MANVAPRLVMARALMRPALAGRRALTSSGPPIIKPVATLMYTYVEDMETKRAPHRAEHLKAARASAANGDLLLGGAFEDMQGGMLLFSSKEAAEEFALADPYVVEGLVPEFAVRTLSAAAGTFHDVME